MNSENYDEIMKELRVEYLEGFPDKFHLMRNFFDGQDWYSLELEFHKLKGTGTTYGVPEVSELCELMERHCRTQGKLDETILNISIGLLEKISAKYLQDEDFDLYSSADFQQLKTIPEN